ncbi:uncharacterized protein LOC144581654 [Callithrix jacchus]
MEVVMVVEMRVCEKHSLTGNYYYLKNLHLKTDTFKRQCNSPELPPPDPTNAEGLVVCLSALHLLCHSGLEGISQRTPAENSLPFSRARSGSRRRRCQVPESASGRLRAPVPPVHLFTPPSPRSARRGGAGFPPTREAVLARPGIAGPPSVDEFWNPSPPHPSHSARALGARKSLGWLQGTRIRDAASLQGGLNLSSTSPSPCASALGDAQPPGRPGTRRARARHRGGSAPHCRPGHPRGWGRKARAAAGRVRQAGAYSPTAGRRLRGRSGAGGKGQSRGRKGAGPQALVGVSSGAGRAGPGRRRGRRWARELPAREEESRAAGAELEEAVAAARAAGQRSETASTDRARPAGRSRVGGALEPSGQEAVAAARAGRGRKPAGGGGFVVHVKNMQDCCRGEAHVWSATVQLDDRWTV